MIGKAKDQYITKKIKPTKGQKFTLVNKKETIRKGNKL